MPFKQNWRYEETQRLIEHYPTATIQELEKMFPNRSADAINARIKRLKLEGKISDNKEKEAIDRALRQRRG